MKMYVETIGNTFDGIDASGQDGTTVSENDAGALPEEAETAPLPEQEETSTEIETAPETVSGNDTPAPPPAVVTVSGNVVAFADSGITSGMDSLNGEMSVLSETMAALSEEQSETNTILLGMASILVMLLFFTVFKWCEQKIKRFVKGVFNRYE